MERVSIQGILSNSFPRILRYTRDPMSMCIWDREPKQFTRYRTGDTLDLRNIIFSITLLRQTQEFKDFKYIRYKKEQIVRL